MKPRTAAFIVAVLVVSGFASAGLGAGSHSLRGLRAPNPPQPSWAGLSSESIQSPTTVEAAPGLPATVASVSFTKQLIPYPVRDAAGTQIGNTTWRVVRGTGNCCENHLGITKEGRLMDFGGAYINFSDDQGQTWKQVRPAEPLVGPEGTVVVAPGG
ncbi:MAG: hypothetical protein ACRDH9_08115, partial [Actinomycetota bacterium]